MVVKLISKFHHLAADMDLAVQSGNTQEINKLDRQLVETWEHIITRQPTNAIHVPQTIEFLVDQLVAYPDADEHSRSIKDKILELVTYLTK